MITVFINNEIAYVPSNTTILEACEFIGIEIPRFCFHRRLTVAGNCRMCLVEIQKSPKPIASCATPVINNMQIFTNTPLVKKSRESVLEYLLVNHPLDCPICDQGGECDLQEQTILFGSDTTRFFDNKRSVENKFFGALVKTVLTRCILCTRCVRFAHDIAGVETLGTTSRGVTTEINFYIQKIFQSELSGNVIDLCPVGALTAKSYTFGARPWEIRSLNAIDLTDAVGSNIRVDFKEKEVIRILPRLKESLNDEWISDKARFNFDYLKKQKVDLWWVRQHKYSKPNLFRQDLIKTSFRKALHGNPQLQKKHILCSVNTDIGFLIKIKSVADILGIKNIGFSRIFFLNTDFSENFLCQECKQHFLFL
jgi:NADH dehydrogenase (ubiquinone) Fe-S protein 1